MLHDIGVTIDYDDHHRHSHYLIVNSGLPGFSPWELEMIAAIARWHRKGEPDAGALGAARAKGRRAPGWACSAGSSAWPSSSSAAATASVAGVELEQDNGAVTPAAHARTAPARTRAWRIWSAQRNSDLLAEAIGEPVEVVAG